MNIIKKYKKSIILVTIISILISGIYLYYKDNIYQAETTLQIGNGKESNLATNDILQEAFIGSSLGDIDTQKAIIKSRFVILNAMKSVDVTTHIWKINKFKKATELYLDAPFRVEVKRGKDYTFTLIPLNDKSFRLKVKGTTDSGVDFEFDSIRRFDRLIKEKYFEIIIKKVGKLEIGSEYRFVVYDSLYYTQDLISKINVNQLDKKSSILKISYTDNIPLRATRFVNAIADEYMKQNIELKTKEAVQILDFINNQLAIIEKNLKISENKIEKFKTDKKTINISMSAEQISKTLAEYESKVGILDMQISLLQNIAKKVKNGKNLDTLTVVGIDINGAKELTELIKNLQQSILEKNALLKEYTKDYPEVQKLKTTIANLKIIIKKSIENMLNSLKEKKRLITIQMKKYQIQLKQFPKIEQDYLKLKRKFTFNEKFYTYLLEKKTETEIKKAATVSQNRIIDRAILPKEPIKPKKKLILAVAFVLGIILGLVQAFVRNFFANTISNIEEIERVTNIPIVGIIPKFKTTKDKRELIILKNPKYAISESFRTLRTNIEFMISKKESKIITITSTIPQEGKSTISSNFAVSLAMKDKKVILVNFDLRKPTIHEIFNLPNKNGLSNYLSNQIDDIDKIIQHTNIKNIDIISSGPVPPNPNELIGSNKSIELLEELKNRYDFIILDTPPIGLVSDTMTLLTHSDLALYIIRIDYSKKEFIKGIEKLKEKANIKSLGIVVNMVNLSYGYGYGYGYGYYGKD